MMLVAVTASIVAVSASHFATSEASDPPAKTLAMTADLAPARDALRLVHLGGAPIDLGDIEVRVRANGEEVYSLAAGPSGTTWAPGDTLTIPLPGAVPIGVDVDVALVVDGRDGAFATVDHQASSAAAPILPPVGFALGLSVDGAPNPTDLAPSSIVPISAAIAHPDGRKHVRYVYADLSAIGGPAWLALADGGVNGDLVAGDGVYAVLVKLPPVIHPGQGLVKVYAIDLNGAHAAATIDLATALPPAPIPPPPPTPDPTPDAPTDDPAPPPTPRFEILPPGGIRLPCGGTSEIKVLGTAITYGATGPNIPVTTWVTLDGGATFASLFGGAPVMAGDTVQYENLPPESILGLKGRAQYSTFDHTYVSFQNDPHVRVLKDGDSVPQVPGFGSQDAVEVFLRGYVDVATQQVTLAPNQAIVLFEFNPTLTVAAADFQDLVVLFTFEPGGCPA